MKNVYRLEGQPRYKIWWIPQVPMKPFVVEIGSLEVAKVLLDSLAQYDLFQLDNRIKPDFCNAGGLMVWDEGLDPDEHGDKWTDFEDDNGRDLDSLTLQECHELDQSKAQNER